MSCLCFKHRETSANYPGRAISILSSAIFFYSSEQRFSLFPKQFVPCAHSHAEITVLAGLGVWLEIADVVNVQGGGSCLSRQHIQTGKINSCCLFPSSGGNAGRKMRLEGDTPKMCCCRSCKRSCLTLFPVYYWVFP